MFEKPNVKHRAKTEHGGEADTGQAMEATRSREKSQFFLEDHRWDTLPFEGLRWGRGD